jgi:hypothetical protein
VRVSREVAIEPDVSRTKLRFRLVGARVQAKNNTFPLVTAHFDSPVRAVRLVEAAKGAELTIELKAAATVSHRVVKGRGGSMVLMLELAPASSADAAAPEASAAPASKAGATVGGQPSPKAATAPRAKAAR